MQVSKFPGWYQKIPQITVILLTITTLVVVEWWWWHHHHHYNTTTITLYHHHHHSTTTVTIKFSCVAIYAVLSQNYFVFSPDLRVFGVVVRWFSGPSIHPSAHM